MTRSSSVRLAGRDSPRDERGRDVKLDGILSLWSLKLVTGARCATPRCRRRVSALSPYSNRRLRMCSVHWHDRRPGLQGSSWWDGEKRKTESSFWETRSVGHEEKEKTVQGKRSRWQINPSIAEDCTQQSRLRNPLTSNGSVMASYSAPLHPSQRSPMGGRRDRQLCINHTGEVHGVHLNFTRSRTESAPRVFAPRQDAVDH